MSPAKVRLTLRWLERMLFVVGGALALWCVVVVLRAEYYDRIPVPEPPVAPRLPGEDPGNLVREPPRQQGTWLARLEAPSVDLAATVLEGSDDDTLSRGAGHIEDTALPGDRGNVGIAGHRDTVFRPLRHVHVGDQMTLTTAEHVFLYRVSETKIVGPEEVSVLDPTDHPAMTLVTCYPFEFIGHAPRRFIVRAGLVSEQSRASGPSRLPMPDARKEPAVASDIPAVASNIVVVDPQFQRAARRPSDRLHVRRHPARGRVVHAADETADRHGARRVGNVFHRFVSVGARGLRRALTEINPARRSERD